MRVRRRRQICRRLRRRFVCLEPQETSWVLRKPLAGGRPIFAHARGTWCRLAASHCQCHRICRCTRRRFVCLEPQETSWVLRKPLTGGRPSFAHARGTWCRLATSHCLLAAVFAHRRSRTVPQCEDHRHQLPRRRPSASASHAMDYSVSAQLVYGGCIFQDAYF